MIIDNPPFNSFGPDTMPQLAQVVDALESDRGVGSAATLHVGDSGECQSVR
ncbi:hypothetical protein QCE73_21505 [Caballeronia sp. LZ029]|uniref:hypothetical protein n=1 Tax=Caballeronia sp. LZ029 TaxID=3038564 RepID=UPI0028598DB4|nr:hypothetical protein [Caballeronia sp. LZ029]MDR5745744.1 hypothetical protein [Caballeronia sp. LZ029]